MSSGLTLLRQLQARQKLDTKACNYVGDRQKKYDASEAETPDDDSIVGPSSTTSTRTARSAKEEQITIEVCLGPDCAVAGGGAALLEIEDLIRFSASSEKELSVVSGGCRDHCSEGPNVRSLSTVKGICDSEFSRVNCPDACRRIVRALDSSKETTNAKESVEMSPVSKLLKRKQDSRRWQEHRQKAAKDRRLQAKVRENTTRNS